MRYGTRFRAAVGLLLLLAVVAGCAMVPYTRRSQLVLLSEAQEVNLGAAAYEQILGKAEVVRDPEVKAVMERVGRRIARAAAKPDYEWQFAVIDDPKQRNAFALPGGKVGVYTGLFPVAEDEAGLAVVIGHEVAHALARHGAERMSQGILLQLGAIGLSAAIGDSSPATREAIFQAYGLGAQVGVLLPFGRSQEAEADRIGMILTALAGYDPSAALALWERMEARAGDKTPPEFLSTHPSYDTRRQNIRAWLPEARQYYKDPVGQPVAKLPSIAGSAGANDR